MNHQNYSSPEPGLMQERAPLTRLRASTRPMSASLPDALLNARALLPDVRGWAGLFNDPALGGHEAAALNEVSRARRLATGAVVFGQGDVARGLLLVSEGDVAVGVRGDDGGFRTERHVHGPAWLDLSTALLGACYNADARVMTPATLIELPREATLALAERFASLARRLLMAVAQEARAMALNTHDLMHRDAPGRLAAWLLAHCQLLGQTGPTALVQLPMRKRDIASQLAITPETLSRLMRSFSSQGVIQVEGYTVHVLDVPGLRRLAQA